MVKENLESCITVWNKRKNESKNAKELILRINGIPQKKQIFFKEIIRKQIEVERETYNKILEEIETMHGDNAIPPPSGIFKSRCPCCSSKLFKKKYVNKNEFTDYPSRLYVYICPRCGYSYAKKYIFTFIRFSADSMCDVIETRSITY